VATQRAVLTFGGLYALLVSASCQSGGANAASAPGGILPSAPPSSPAATAPTFNATRAFADLEKQVAFGPRVPNTNGHRATRDYLLAELKKTCDRAFLQDFSRTLGGKTLKMSNIVGVINESAPKQVMLCAHWDTRPTADEEIETAKKRQPIPGANDGASGVAVLLEVARMFHAKRPDVGVQIVLFDGEDYGPGLERMFLGARHYAKNPAVPKPAYAILVDMIGDKDLQIYRERNSENFAPEINDKVWKAVADLNLTATFPNSVRFTIEDDHIPLQQAGIKAIDLIDFDYAPWHTLDDTPDKCAPASLKAVGDVLARVVYTETK
jgi:Zn-dependent M28 family amino/carboxypeptidase